MSLTTSSRQRSGAKDDDEEVEYCELLVAAAVKSKPSCFSTLKAGNG